MEGAPRKGAAYDGDSSRDKDYYEGTQSKKKKGVRVPNLPPEARWATFLNTLAAVSSSTRFSHRLFWYGCFSTKRLPSEEGQTRWTRKPDLILLGREDASPRDLEKTTWRSIKALGELTSSKFSKSSILNKSLSTKIYILLCSQPWRRYALAISLASDELRIHLFDRSGVVVSPPIKFHANITETCRIIQAFASADDVTLGYDPTLQISPQLAEQPPTPFVGTVQIDSTTYNIIEVLWTSNGFVGRCTSIYHVRPQDAPPRNDGEEVDRYDFVVKDVWPEEHVMGREQMILERIAGIEGIPTLVKAWTVQYNGENDTTLRHRPSDWDMTLSPRYTTRVHRRLLMTSVGSPLSSFRSQRELLCGLIMALESAYCLIPSWINTK
jgi:Fungal protein kinase